MRGRRSAHSVVELAFGLVGARSDPSLKDEPYRQYFRQSHFNQIAAHAVAGQNDEAFALIHEAISKHGVPPAAIAEDLLESPKMKNLLNDPRFQALKN